MKESYRKGLASHPGPESCVGHRKVAGEALTGENAGPVSSCEINPSRASTPFVEAEGNTGDVVTRESSTGPAQSETRSMRGNSLRGTREVPQVPAADGAAGRSGKVSDRTPDTHACGKSDGCTVPKKPPNKGGETPRRRRWREGGRPRGTRARRPRPGHSAGPACRSAWSVCERQHVGTDVHGSPPCCTM